MNPSKSFRIGVRRKIPYLTNFFLQIGGCCFLVIIVFDFIFSPFENGGQEIQSAIFYWLVPEFWKKVLLFSIVGIFVTSVLYGVLRYYRLAILVFSDTEIYIRGKTINLTIPIADIRKVYCNDARDRNGEPKLKFGITLEQRGKSKPLSIKIKNYDEVDDFMEQLFQYKGVDMMFYDFSFHPTHLEED